MEPVGSTNALITQSVSFSGDTTMIAANFSSNISPLVLTDDNSAPASGDFKIRIVNAARAWVRPMFTLLPPELT